MYMHGFGTALAMAAVAIFIAGIVVGSLIVWVL